ncbi:hypothetical protein RclHR1_02630011 [Rhizophagus clarus]|uniref:Granulins domain-containing protein n=1 Tax=Rhizophagus clarus TaxID=94130 RepID=A0A140D0B1_9GLOM|nr:hypothetical protein [Rhizophagus clarus]GBB95866.1 hypothetical protein RclHR1_02630011 [Rhizophagus clarus]GES80921.1 hypothetical protein GLOIN_2v1704946 [Rhizophagus clarus]
MKNLILILALTFVVFSTIAFSTPTNWRRGDGHKLATIPKGKTSLTSLTKRQYQCDIGEIPCGIGCCPGYSSCLVGTYQCDIPCTTSDIPCGDNGCCFSYEVCTSYNGIPVCAS